MRDDEKSKHKKDKTADELRSVVNKTWERMEKSQPRKAADLARAAASTEKKASSIEREGLDNSLPPRSEKREIKRP